MSEAEIAKNVGYKFECKKDALRQVQDGGVKVTLNIHPAEMPTELYSDPMGQRYVAVIVPINDDETPRLVPGSTGNTEVKGSPEELSRQQSSAQAGDKPKSFAGHAKMLAQDEDFARYIAQRSAEWWEESSAFMPVETVCEEYIENMCGVQSCSEFIEGTEAARKLKRLQAQFLQWRDN